MNKKLAGFILAIVVGLFAWWIAGFHKALDALVVGIVLGMVIRTFLGERAYLLPGLEFAPKFFIPLGIILYGVNLKFHKLIVVPGIFWLQLIIGMVVIFLVAVYLGRKLGIRDQLSLLIATGTSICGASAIALATPLVKADSEETGASLITITIFGLIGMFLYPLAITYFELSKTGYALLCATTLHQTGLVKTAAFAMGKDCLYLALSIKMARTALIIPIIGFLCWYTGRKTTEGSPERERREEKKEKFFLFRIPWFLWVFVLVGFLVSFIPTLAPLAKTLKPWAGFFWTFALTSIGLTVDLKRMLNVGGVPLIVGLATWLTAIGVFILGNAIF